MTKRVFSQEYKDALLKKLQPPESRSVPEIAAEENIPTSTLYTWISKARRDGALIPNSAPQNDRRWRSDAKMRIVMETYSMNEEELGQYCRQHGLYSSDIRRWSAALETALDGKPSKEMEAQLRTEKTKNKELERELRYKEKALAEAAALLVMQKKTEAIWGDPEDD